MIMETWSVRERQQLTKLLNSVKTIHRKAAKLQAQFDEREWPAEIAFPLMNLKICAERAVNSISREGGRK